MDRDVTVICGGVGAARFLRGLQLVVPPERIAAVVNTGDDTVLHGLSISPDLDTITYTLAGAIDPGRGWGLAGETWHAMEAIARYEPVRPAGSTAATTWFNLGDRDLATHLYRTARRAEGATPTAIADEMRRAWGLDVRLLPMTDGELVTMVELATGEEVSFQDYFVRLRHGVPVRAIRFAGSAAPTASRARGAGDRRRDRHRPLQPARLDRSRPRPARRRRGPGGAPRARRRRVADRRWCGPQGTGRPDARRARPRGVGRRRRPAVRPRRGDARHRPRRRRAGGGRRGGRHARRCRAVGDVHARRSRADARPGSDAGRRPSPRIGPIARGARAGDVGSNGAVSAGRRGPRRASSTATRRGGCGPAPGTRRSGRARPGPAATYVGGPPSGATSAHRSRSDVCTPVPTLTTSPLPRWPERTRASTTSST